MKNGEHSLQPIERILTYFKTILQPRGYKKYPQENKTEPPISSIQFQHGIKVIYVIVILRNLQRREKGIEIRGIQIIFQIWEFVQTTSGVRTDWMEKGIAISLSKEIQTIFQIREFVQLASGMKTDWMVPQIYYVER